MIGPVGLAGFAVVVFLVGWWCAHRMIADQDLDPGWVVVDEVAGVCIALVVAPHTVLWFAVGFALFRFFDIVKPWPVSWADQRVGGALGVMLDDVLAGLYAAGILVAASSLLA